MNACVVDASVAIKFVIEEIDSSIAIGLLAKTKLRAPGLLRVESANVLRRIVKSKKLTRPEARQALRRIVNLVELLPDSVEEALLTLDLAVELDHPAQDCRYLAAAIAAKVPLITADESFVRKARTAGHKAHTLAEVTGPFE